MREPVRLRAILSIAAGEAAAICLATSQLHQTRKNDPFKGRLATLVIFSFVPRRSRSKLHGNTLVLLSGTAGTVSSFRENLLRFLAARCIRNQQPLVCAIHAPRKKGLSQRGAIFQLA